jgi:radical SAM superfamily enzyme YgiQ (UPF0313 family)
MRVLLISTNRLRPTQTSEWLPVEPLGLAYVAAGLRNAGHEVQFLDLCFVERQDAAIVDVIERSVPDVIGISLRNIEMMAYFQNVSFLDELQSAVDICRHHSDARIILGGSGFSIMPAQLLRHTGLDLGIVGEGERSLPDLLSRLELDQDYSDIPGVVQVVDDQVQFTPPDRNQDISNLLAPARDLIDHSQYVRAGGTVNLQTKRGCPFKCIYCTYPLIEGTNVRCRRPDEVAEEFRVIDSEFGVKEAYVVDNQFNYPLDHAKEVCEKLVALRDEIKVWWSCMLNPGYLSEELVLLLRLARCTMVDLSIESASDRVLDSLGKNFSTGEIRNAITLLKKYLLPFTTWILLGGPGETKETVQETLGFLAELEVPSVLFSIGLRVCPGTEIERLMRGDGRIGEGDDLLGSVFYLSMSAEELAELVLPYCKGRKGWRIAALEHPDES